MSQLRSYHQDYFHNSTETSSLFDEEKLVSAPDLEQHLESAASTGTRLLQTTEKPVVLDADALNLLASNKNLLNRIPRKGSILTPLSKEFDRIAGEVIRCTNG